MSIWTELKGYIYLNKNSKCSVRTLIEEVFDETSTIQVDLVGKLGETQQIRIEFMYSDDGESALKTARMFIDRLKEYDKKVYCDILFTTRLF